LRTGGKNPTKRNQKKVVDWGKPSAEEGGRGRKEEQHALGKKGAGTQMLEGRKKSRKAVWEDRRGGGKNA